MKAAGSGSRPREADCARILRLAELCNFIIIDPESRFKPIFPKYFGLVEKLADFAVVFKLGVRRINWSGGFVERAGIFARISGDFGPSARVQGTAIEPLLS